MNSSANSTANAAANSAAEFANRTASVERNTNETQIAVELDLDGTGRAELATGVPFLDHMLDQVARHGMLDLTVRAKGDLHIDGHHTVEDIGITIGQAFKAGRRRQEGHRPLRARLRPAGRGAVARRGRPVRPARASSSTCLSRGR